MKLSYLIILLLMNFFWAGVYSAYKVIGQAPGVAANDPHVAGGIVTLRFGLAGICMLLAWPWLPGLAPRGRALVKTIIMGLALFVFGQRCQVFGNQIGTAGNSSVLMAVEPLLTSVAAALFLREHIGPRRLAGFALGLVGVGLLNKVWSPDFQWTSLTASLIFLSSFICEAAYSVIGKPVVAQAGAMKVLAISLLVGLAGNLLIDGPTTIATAQALSFKAWSLLFFMAIVCTVIGYTVWFVVIRDCPINVAALTVFSQAVFGVAIAWLWVGEALHWGQFFGCLTIVAGLALGLSRQIQRPSSGASPPADVKQSEPAKV